MPGVRRWRDGNPGLPRCRGDNFDALTAVTRDTRSARRIGVLAYGQMSEGVRMYPLSVARSGALHERRAALSRGAASGERQRFADREARALTKPN
jgi:hypothetical protein